MTKHIPKISIIVPVYKVEKYLQKCIDSILAQTFQDFEVILVDDGSPDNCSAMCDAMAEQDERIVVIHQKNAGLSAARNVGLDMACGQYIGFVDGDDFIEPEMYEKMYMAIQEYCANLAICNFIFVDEKARPLEAVKNKTQVTVLSREKAISRITETRYHVAWNKLYHRDIFATLRYPEGRLNEDSFIAPDILESVEKAVYLPQQFYCYRQRSGSIMNQKKTLKNYDAVEAAYGCWKCLLRNGQKERLENGVKFIIESLSVVYCGLSKEERRSEKSKKMKWLLEKARQKTVQETGFSLNLFAQCFFFRWFPKEYQFFKSWKYKR